MVHPVSTTQPDSSISLFQWSSIKDFFKKSLFKNSTQDDAAIVDHDPIGPVSVVIPALNEAKRIAEVVKYALSDPITGEVQRERAIIDDKTGKLTTDVTHDKNDDKNDEDVQLAFYVNLFDGNDRAQITQAGYVGVSSDPIKPLSKEKPHAGNSSYPQAWLNPSMTAPDNAALQTAATELHGRVDGLFKRMYAGDELQAMGELTACAWCEVRGICRKGYTTGA